MRNVLFLYHRGIIEKSLGQSAAAVASLTQALKIDPY
jgi:lipoprotein NlpI